MKTMQTIAGAGQESDLLRAELAAMGLDPEPVSPCGPTAVSQLRALLEWAKAWRGNPDRRKLEALGYRHPPVDPDLEPETDWLRFERWMRGEPLTWSYVREFGPLVEVADRVALETELACVLGRLEERGVVLDLMDGVPVRLVYEYLGRELSETEFEVTAPGTRQHLGCADDCAKCFQRAWCDLAMDDGFDEEEDEA